MDTRVGRGLSRARSESAAVGDPRRFPPLAELAFELPVRMARTVGVLLQPGSTHPGRDGIGVRPMSYEWLRECAVDCAKRGDLL